jgi:hypothetical protein
MTMSSVLERSGRVRPGYAHESKLVRPGSLLFLDDAVLKWYEISVAEAPIPLRIRELAYDALCRGTRSGELELSGDLGFVILHRCGDSFYFLLVSTWRNENELWETVWAKPGPGDPDFEPWPVDSSHRPTFCVWELGAVCHEQRAWSRYLRSPRDASARQEYLLDSFVGEV